MNTTQELNDMMRFAIRTLGRNRNYNTAKLAEIADMSERAFRDMMRDGKTIRRSAYTRLLKEISR